MAMSEYLVNFVVPRDIELKEGFKTTTNLKNAVISASVKKRILVAKEFHLNTPKATIVGNEDRHGNIYQTEFEISLNIDVSLDKKLDKDMRKKYIISKSIDEVNRIINVHQYVNDKYFVLPISESELPLIKITFPDKRGFHFFSPSIKTIKIGPDKDIDSNTERVSDFFNRGEKVIEPVYMFGYARQFYKTGTYRIAITEAQAAIEYLLDLIIKERLKKRDDESLKFYEKTKGKTDFVDVKLGLYLKMATDISIEKELNLKKLRKIVTLRNEIVHGSKSFINKKEAKEAMIEYEKLFDILLKIISGKR